MILALVEIPDAAQLSQYGAMGLIAFVFWKMLQTQMAETREQGKITHAEMSSRITAVEQANSRCETDRIALRDQMMKIQQDVIQHLQKEKK